jgi:hypothetical protein
VEYKIFGPGGTPSEEFREQLAGFLKLDESQRRTIGEIFLGHDFDPYAPTLPSAVGASSLLPEQFSEATNVVGFLLSSWRANDLQLSDIERDLLLLGCSQPEIETMISFLNTLGPIRESVWAKNNIRIQRLDGLPTMDNLNVICDARAVFGGFPEGIDQHDNSYKTLLGLVPIVIMEIICSDNYGRRERTAVQMSEDQFERLRKILAQANEQLTILKERIGAAKLVV